MSGQSENSGSAGTRIEASPDVSARAGVNTQFCRRHDSPKKDGMEGDHEARRTGRRNLLRGAALTAASMGAPSLAGCATAASAQRSNGACTRQWAAATSRTRFRSWTRTAATTRPGLGWSHPASTTSRVASPAPPNSSGRASTAPATGSPSARGRRTTRSCRASAGPRKGWRATERGRTSDSRSSGDRLSPRTRCTTFTPQSGRADCTGWWTYRRAGSMFRLTAGRRPCG